MGRRLQKSRGSFATVPRPAAAPREKVSTLITVARPHGPLWERRRRRWTADVQAQARYAEYVEALEAAAAAAAAAAAEATKVVTIGEDWGDIEDYVPEEAHGPAREVPEAERCTACGQSFLASLWCEATGMKHYSKAAVDESIQRNLSALKMKIGSFVADAVDSPTSCASSRLADTSRGDLRLALDAADQVESASCSSGAASSPAAIDRKPTLPTPAPSAADQSPPFERHATCPLGAAERGGGQGRQRQSTIPVGDPAPSM
eukprot:TRINITY_DN937_c0_g1_i3.p1 TRINITY_DN937_c0_g1~~TRINITY_DN937_c0_g1_i3.p1  ORF type:complete len:261 (+),score=56.69 TRINITY_DN937_c0_g1_i3:506-1288(+)